MRENEIYDRIDIIKYQLRVNPYSHILNLLLLSYNLLLRDFKTIEDYSERLSIDSPNPCTHYELFRGINYLNNGNIKDANVAFKYALNIDPENHYPYLFKGLVNLKEGKSAKELFAKAISFATPYDRGALISITNEKEDEKLAIIFSEENLAKKEFVNVIEELVKSNPNDPIFKIALAEAYYKIGNYEKILKVLESVFTSYPDYPHALFLTGKILDEYLNNPNKANEYFKKAFKANPLSKYQWISLDLGAINEPKEDEFEELITLFKNEKPIIGYFEEKYKEIISEKETVKTVSEPQKIEVKKEEVKEPVSKENEEPKEKEIKAELDEKQTIEYGIKLLKDGKYKEATEFFLKKLKESQNK